MTTETFCDFETQQILILDLAQCYENKTLGTEFASHHSEVLKQV